MSSICLLLTSLALGQNYDRAEWRLVPQFVPGVELVYRGTCTELSLVPGVQHERQYDLEMILLMESVEANMGRAVLQTSLSLQEPRALGSRQKPAVPGSVRMELVHIDRRGGLHPRGKTGARLNSLAVPLDGPPVIETGAFAELPIRPVNMLSYWEQLEMDRPLRSWRVAGVERCQSVACLKLQWTQQSPDWKKPRGDSTAWRRQETLWFALQSGQVFRVERIIERRDPGRSEPTQRIITRYDLESRFRYVAEPGNDSGGRMFEERVQEISRFLKFQEESLPLLQQPAQYRRNIDAMLTKIASAVDSHPPTPYRPSLLYLKNKLLRAQSGELPVAADIAPASHRIIGPEVNPTPGKLHDGDKVPDCVVTELTGPTGKNAHRFKEYLGQPVLVLYYDPTTATGREVLQFAQKLWEEVDDLQILGMAVSDDLDRVLRQHKELHLSFPIFDGKGMLRTFGVDGTPRVVLLDDEGRVRWAFTGWGRHSADEVSREVRRLISPSR